MKILIIGAGPVGLTCAHLLGRLGIPCTILEKQLKLTNHPSAHFLHSRTLEIFSGLNISDKLYKDMPSPDHWRRFIYCSKLQGEVYRSHDHFLSLAYKKNLALSTMQPAHYPQHKLVNLLKESLPSSCELLLGKEFKELHFDEGVTVKTILGDVYKANYLIACDGSASKVRSFLNIPLTSSGILQSFLNIHFTSKKLGDIAKKDPAMIYFVYNPQAVVVIVMHSADEGEFVMQVPFYPPLTHPSDYSEAQINDLVNSCVQSHEYIDDIHIKSMKQWKMTTRCANFIKKDKVFLAGDAAHSLTPAGGFGLNTGIGDAHNLCWKFYYPELLDSYQQERIPRIQEIIKSSIINYNLTVDIAKNFGLKLSYAKNYQSIAEKIPFGSYFFKIGMKLGQKYLINDKNARSYLSHENNLLHLVHPTEDLEYKYEAGFFSNNGSLAPNTQVVYNENKYSLRLLPGVISYQQGKPLFIRVHGKASLPDFQYPSIDIESTDTHSYIIRPDGHIYWSSK
jgi:2-polyprenyl-6-methoxyphenol hydroxylase-like FAD-dependent oxidoreductase